MVQARRQRKKVRGWEKFSALRKKLGLKQSDVAERAKLPDGHVRQIEAGYSQLKDHSTRLAVARGYGVSIIDFDRYLAGELTLLGVVRKRNAAEKGAAHVSPPNVSV